MLILENRISFAIKQQVISKASIVLETEFAIWITMYVVTTSHVKPSKVKIILIWDISKTKILNLFKKFQFDNAHGNWN